MRKAGAVQGSGDDRPAVGFGAVTGGLIGYGSDLYLILVNLEGHFPGRQHIFSIRTGHVFGMLVGNPECPSEIYDKSCCDRGLRCYTLVACHPTVRILRRVDSRAVRAVVLGLEDFGR